MRSQEELQNLGFALGDTFIVGVTKPALDRQRDVGLCPDGAAERRTGHVNVVDGSPVPFVTWGNGQPNGEVNTATVVVAGNGFLNDFDSNGGPYRAAYECCLEAPTTLAPTRAPTGKSRRLH